MNSKRMSTQTLVLGAIMTAFVVLFQLIGTFTTFFGPLSTALALIPIVIGAAMCGTGVGAWLGLVFGMVVLISVKGTQPFIAFDVPGTVITVLAKGIGCGFAAGLVYNLLKKFNTYFAVVCTSIICPAVNTGIFLLGCRLFFMDDALKIAEALHIKGTTGMALFVGMATANFLFELGANVVVSPIIVRLLNIKRG